MNNIASDLVWIRIGTNITADTWKQYSYAFTASKVSGTISVYSSEGSELLTGDTIYLDNVEVFEN